MTTRPRAPRAPQAPPAAASPAAPARRCPRPRREALRAFVAGLTGVGLLVGASGCGMLPEALGGEPARETLTVMTFAPEGTQATNMPGMPAMAEAYARWVNARGGLSGRTLRVITCNEHNTAAGARACAQRAVEERALAVVGSYSQHGRSFTAPLESAGIPFLGGYGVSAEEFQSPLSYPVNGGQSALLAGAGRQLAVSCRKVVLVRPDTLAGDVLPELLNVSLKDRGQPVAQDVRAPEDTADFAAEARAARTGAGTDGGCVAAVLGERTETFADAFRRQGTGTPTATATTEDAAPSAAAPSAPSPSAGPTGPAPAADAGGGPRLSSVLGSVSQGLVDRTGGKDSPFEGAYVTGWYPVATDPVWNPMRKVITDHAFGDDRVDADDSGVQTTWIAYNVLAEMVRRLDHEAPGQPVTADRLARALDRADPVDTAGLTPDLSWRFHDMRAIGGFPRLVNGRVTFQQVRGGRLVSQGETARDMTAVLEKAPIQG
ncbi:ABC transporter substrate-binding protein [Streptomyces sp. BI20]|uniref:ABC transporter substrate-binding protein n=1 Tax=Streptomyces sp. BI20 TaxID=3403460 RepID=UPI003C71B3AE